MQPLEPPTGRSARLALVAIALLALLAVVAFSSRSGFGHSTQAKPTPGYLNYAFTTFLIVFVLAIPVAIWGFLLQAREGGFQRSSLRSRLIQNILTVVVFLAIAVAVMYIKRHHGHLFGNTGSNLNKASNALKHRQAQAPQKVAPRFEWTVLWIAIAILSATVAGLFVNHRRRKRRTAIPLELEPTVADELASSMSEAIEDLEAEPDARRAVIAAYARMERVLASHGLRRRPSETPLEYLRRVLGGLTQRAAAVERLTGLFEQAKFSQHAIDPSMKQGAIAALREIRDDLRGSHA